MLHIIQVWLIRLAQVRTYIPYTLSLQWYAHEHPYIQPQQIKSIFRCDVLQPERNSDVCCHHVPLDVVGVGNVLDVLVCWKLFFNVIFYVKLLIGLVGIKYDGEEVTAYYDVTHVEK